MNPQPDMHLVARSYHAHGPRRPWADVLDDYAAQTGQTVGYFTAEPTPIDLGTDVTGERKCATCKEMKPVDQFPIRRDSPDGPPKPRNYCKACKRASDADRERRRNADTAAAPLPAELNVRRDEWQRHAACRGRIDLFFPDDNAGVQAAKRICRTCPVQAACLAYAVHNGENDGVWGAKSKNEIRRIRRHLGLEEVAA